MMNKKKLLSLALAVSMILSQISPAYAAESGDFYVQEDMVVQDEADPDAISQDIDVEEDAQGMEEASEQAEDTEISVQDADFEDVVDSEVVELDQVEEVVDEEDTEESVLGQEEVEEQAVGAKKDSSSSSSSKDASKDDTKKSVSLNQTKLETQHINVKKKVKIKIPGVKGKEAKRVVWTSSNDKFAQVKKGKVVGIARGMAEIHGVLDGMDYVTTVYVNEPKVRPGKKITMDIGETCWGTITGVLDQPIKWENKKPEVAQVTASGNGFVVVAKAKGSSKVVCQIGKKKYKITVKVGKGTYDNKQKLEWETEDLWPPVKENGIKVPGERLFKCSNGTCYSRYFYNYGKHPYDPDGDDDGGDDGKDDGKDKVPEKIDEDRDDGTPGGDEDSIDSSDGVTISMNEVKPGEWVDHRNIFVTINHKIVRPYGPNAYVWTIKGTNPHTIDAKLWQATPNFTATANGTYELWIKTVNGIIKGGEITIGNIDDQSPTISEEIVVIKEIPTLRVHVTDLKSEIKSITVIDPNGKKSSVTVPNGKAPKVSFDLYDYLTVPGTYVITAVDHCCNETRVYYKVHVTPNGGEEPSEPVTPDKRVIIYNARYPDGTNQVATQERNSSTIRYARPIDLNFAMPEGYVFKGWTEDAAGTTVQYIAGGHYNIDKDKTVYGIWELNSYVINYELDGGVNDPANPATFTVKDGEITLKPATKRDYDFTGWYSDDQLVHKVEKIDTKSVGYITLYAGWKLKGYDIVYHLDGGKNSEENPNKYSSADAPILLKDASKKHYTFDGWYADENCVRQVFTIDTSTRDTVHVYAKFVPIVYTVTYMISGNEINDEHNPTQFTVSDNDIELRDASKQYYRFEGWYSRFDLSDASKVTKIDCSNGEDRILYPKFVKNTFTMTKEEGYEGEYDGQPHSITIETSTPGAKIEYSTNNGETWTENKPFYTAIGDYQIYYRLTKDNYEPYINDLMIEIKPISLTDVAEITLFGIGVSGNMAAYDYNGQEHRPSFKVMYKGEELAEGQDYSYEYKDNINAGIASLVVKGENLYGGTVTKTFVINKINPIYTAPQARSLAYNEADQILVTNGTTEDGTIMFALSKEGEDDNFTDTLPRGREVGTYTVKWYIKGDRNHNDTEVSTLTVVIAKGDGQLTVAKSGYVYGTAPTELTLYSSTHDMTGVTVRYVGRAYSVSDNGTGAATGEEYDSNKEAVNAGAYTVVVSLPETANYKAVQRSVDYKIYKADGDITDPEVMLGIVYDGKAHELITPATSNTGTVKYKVNDGEYGTDIPTGTDAGTYKVYYKAEGTNNYKPVPELSVTVTISKADGKVVLSSQSGDIVYPISATVTVSENISGGAISAESDDESRAIVAVNGNNINIIPGTTPGPVTITVRSAATKNYKAASATYTALIKKGTLGEVFANNKESVYTGSTQYLTAPICTTPDVVFTYGTGADSYDYTDITSPMLGLTNVGSKTVYWKASKAGYNDKVGSYVLTITKADALLTTPTGKLLTYNEEAQTLVNAGSAEGGVLYYGIGSSSASEPANWSESLPKGTNVGAYYIWTKVVGDANHKDIPAAYACTSNIAKGTLGVITADNQSKVYNGSMQYLNAVTCTTAGTTIVYGNSSGTYGYTSISNFGLKDVGSRTVYYKVSKAGYNDKTGSYTLTIVKAASTMTKPTAVGNLVYSGSSQTLVNAGSATGGTIQYAFGTNATTAPTSGWQEALPARTDVGTYYIWSRVAGDDNHTDVAAAYACTATIKNADLGAVTAANLTKTYNGNMQYLNAVTCATSGVTISYGTSVGDYSYSSITNSALGRTDVGSKTVYYKVSKTGYNDSTGSYTLTISKATPTMTKPTARTGLKANGSAQTLVTAGSTTGGTIQYATGTSSAVTSSWSAALPTGTSAGTYYVWSRVVGGTNYNDVAASYACSVTIASASTGTVDYMTCLYADGSVYKTKYQSVVAALSHSSDSGNTVATGITSGTYSYTFKVVGSDKDSNGFLFHATNMKDRTIKVSMTWTNSESGAIAVKTYSGTSAPTLSSTLSTDTTVASGATSTTTLKITSDGYYGFGFDAGGGSASFPIQITITYS